MTSCPCCSRGGAAEPLLPEEDPIALYYAHSGKAEVQLQALKSLYGIVRASVLEMRGEENHSCYHSAVVQELVAELFDRVLAPKDGRRPDETDWCSAMYGLKVVLLGKDQAFFPKVWQLFELSKGRPHRSDLLLAVCVLQHAHNQSPYDGERNWYPTH